MGPNTTPLAFLDAGRCITQSQSGNSSSSSNMAIENPLQRKRRSRPVFLDRTPAAAPKPGFVLEKRFDRTSQDDPKSKLPGRCIKFIFPIHDPWDCHRTADQLGPQTHHHPWPDRQSYGSPMECLGLLDWTVRCCSCRYTNYTYIAILQHGVPEDPLTSRSPGVPFVS